MARELLRALAGRDDPTATAATRARAGTSVGTSASSGGWSGLRDPWWHARVAALASRECDVFLSTNSFVTACLTRCPTVPVVYDLVTFDRSLSPKRRSVIVERLDARVGGEARRAGSS